MDFLRLIPQKVRTYIYISYAIAGVVIGAMNVGFESAGVADPVWFNVTTEVFAYLGIPLGATAAANVGNTDDEQGKHEE
jgi:hypothetical protein